MKSKTKLELVEYKWKWKWKQLDYKWGTVQWEKCQEKIEKAERTLNEDFKYSA